MLAQDPAADIRRLYEAAAFQEVLAAIETTRIDDREAANIAAQYRALSLVALGRPAEAQRAIGTMISANPLNPITIPHVSPRFRAMTLDLWRPFMRDFIERHYRDGKTAYRAGAWMDANAAFEAVLSAVRHPELGFDGVPRLTDIGELAAEYLELSRTRAAEAQQRGSREANP